MHVVSGQLKQPHVLVGDGIKGAACQQEEWNPTGGHHGVSPHIAVRKFWREEEESVFNTVGVAQQDSNVPRLKLAGN